MSLESEPKLVRAFEAHKAGEYEAAEAAYREILSSEPENPDAFQLLGALLVQVKRFDEALPILRQAVENQPNAPQNQVNLGTAYSRLKRLDDAVNCYQRAIELNPDYIDARKNLGTVLFKLKRYEEAAEQLGRAIDLGASSYDVRLSRATAVLKAGFADEAIGHFDSLVTSRPDDVRPLAGLGQSLLNSPKLKEPEILPRAIAVWERLVQKHPENPAYLNNLATVLKHEDRLVEAKEVCARALNIEPEYFPALCNLGIIHAALGDFQDARATLTQATDLASQGAQDVNKIDLKSHLTTAYCQLASVTNILGNATGAMSYVDEALGISPDDVESRLLRGFLNLQEGHYREGWPDYEWRKKGDYAPRTFDEPEWKGEPLAGKTILVHAEQGLGDSIHFVRYCDSVQARGGKVVFLCQRPITKLLSGCSGVDEIIADGDPLPRFDVHIPLLSLPAVFQSSLGDIPTDIPYVHPSDALVKRWLSKLDSIAGYKIGITWQGNREFAHDKFRSIPLNKFSPLAELPGVSLISLQKGDGEDQIADADFEIATFEGVDEDAGAFMDTAAIMQNLDLVVSSDTATVHLAGALGCTTWLAKSQMAEWRWYELPGGKNPWYPTMRLFTQEHLHDWDSVFTNMKNELARQLSSEQRKASR